MTPETECAAKRRPAAVPSLYIRRGKTYVAAPDEILFKHLRRWAAASFRLDSPILDRPHLIEAFLLSKLAPREHEVFAVVLLGREHRLIEYVEVFQGTFSGVNVHTREIVKLALKYNACSVILAHNHPSGNAEPSTEDVHTTRRLQEALSHVQVRVIDHLIVGKTVTSLCSFIDFWTNG